MSASRYVMQDQAGDTVREIMCRSEARPVLVGRPGWLALALLLAAFNLLAVVTPA
jgi:hypothetical protein